MDKEIQTVDDYIAGFPEEIQGKLKSIRQTIRENAPAAIESMAYGMPAYKTNNKPLVYFGGFDKHIGFYATPTGHEKFRDKLSGYTQGKGSVQFPLDASLPLDLIAEIVRFRVIENQQK
ncbi:hypothetical protein P872_19440 [Rhodonellum psychrophilum GCM71 = DSM 17998]|uniref:YdhG-like domain-containing protein n=2 Tax=Rhodonellum TaxID=336827 RepID=U5C0G1_9BACT|nr:MULTISPECIES: DUF1801 domain-containing protein [Rhodonellum]ERM81672.1 hypothetical protein P872_19440 [Rhodonellum psychrophilum GCM71 = DSM 17998]SDY82910.1 Uncharacterized conserved protein YdhG, YjbR/CyaY-like superfamily, DUF1801 family [Rhodonellum ikkaensis]